MFRFFFFISNVEYIHRKQGNIEKISFSLNPRGGVQFFLLTSVGFLKNFLQIREKRSSENQKISAAVAGGDVGLHLYS